MPAGDVKFEDTHYPTDLKRFMKRIGEFSYFDDTNTLHVAPLASVLYSKISPSTSMLDGVIRLDQSRAMEEDSFSRKWIQLKENTLYLYPTDVIGFSETDAWKPLGTVQLHPNRDTGTSIVSEDVEPPRNLRASNKDRIDHDNDIRCFEISVKNPENKHVRHTTLCALSEASRAHWIEGIRQSERPPPSHSSTRRREAEIEAYSKESPSENRVDAFSRLPWAQRT